VLDLEEVGLPRRWYMQTSYALLPHVLACSARGSNHLAWLGEPAKQALLKFEALPPAQQLDILDHRRSALPPTSASPYEVGPERKSWRHLSLAKGTVGCDALPLPLPSPPASLQVFGAPAGSVVHAESSDIITSGLMSDQQAALLLRATTPVEQLAAKATVVPSITKRLVRHIVTLAIDNSDIRQVVVVSPSAHLDYFIDAAVTAIPADALPHGVSVVFSSDAFTKRANPANLLPLRKAADAAAAAVAEAALTSVNPALGAHNDDHHTVVLIVDALASSGVAAAALGAVIDRDFKNVQYVFMALHTAPSLAGIAAGASDPSAAENAMLAAFKVDCPSPDVCVARDFADDPSQVYRVYLRTAYFYREDLMKIINAMEADPASSGRERAFASANKERLSNGCVACRVR
jgi:hypothetical protein